MRWKAIQRRCVVRYCRMGLGCRTKRSALEFQRGTPTFEVSLCYHTDSLPTVNRRVPPTHPSLPPERPLAATGLFTVPTVVPFPECTAFSDRRPLRGIHLGFLHAFLWVNRPLLFIVPLNSSPVWHGVPGFVYPFTCWRVSGGFQVWTIMNQGFINILVQIFAWT